jgi:hypothetical protein
MKTAKEMFEALVFSRSTVEEHLVISQQMKELGWIE